jgi:hypothetical protein
MENWLFIVKDVGFPIAVCLYFMIINNKTIKGNTDALNGIKMAIQFCPNNTQMKGGNGK